MMKGNEAQLYITACLQFRDFGTPLKCLAKSDTSQTRKTLGRVKTDVLGTSRHQIAFKWENKAKNPRKFRFSHCLTLYAIASGVGGMFYE